jgi:hypothetical protein
MRRLYERFTSERSQAIQQKYLMPTISIHGGAVQLVQDHDKVIVEFEIVAFDQARLLKNSPALAVGLRLLHFFIQVLQIEVFLNRQRPRLFAQGPKNRDEVHGCRSAQLLMR